MTNRRFAVALPLAALVVLGSGAGGALAAEPLLITRSVRVTKADSTPTRTHSSPSVAVDPENPDSVLAVSAELRTARCSVDRSTDGGRTWKRLRATPSPPSYPFCIAVHNSGVTQSPIAFGRHHVAYIAIAGWDVQDGRGAGVLLARSSDLGDSWATTVVHDTRAQPEGERENSRPVTSVVVDTSGAEDVVYVGWTSSPAVPPATPVANVPRLAVSVDAGRTFAPPQSLVAGYFDSEATRRAMTKDLSPVPPAASSPAAFGGNGPSLAVDTRGTVFAVWGPYYAFAPAPPQALYLSRSTDRARTFTVTEIVAPTHSIANAIVRWSPLGGPEGTLHLVRESKVPRVQGDRDIVHLRSTDGGRTWSEPRTLNDDDPKLLAGQFLPNLSVAPDGRLDAVWWDFRHDPGTFVNDVYLSSSADNGVTWSRNARVTDQSIDRKLGPWSNGYDIRQPPGVVGTQRYTVVAWDDTRGGEIEGQSQDIYSALAQYHQLPGERADVVKQVLATVVGLMIAGLVVSGVAVVGRRRTSSRAEPERAREPASAGTD